MQNHKRGGWSQSEYKIINKEKYIGDHAPYYRSSWEARMMNFLDLNSKVIRWGSENVLIPYNYMGKNHTYHTDFFVELKDNNNNIRKFIVEIKPHGQGPSANSKGQVSKPKPPKNRTVKALKRYIFETQQWEKNAAKWAAAQSFCAQHGMEFIVLSKEDLF